MISLPDCKRSSSPLIEWIPVKRAALSHGGMDSQRSKRLYQAIADGGVEEVQALLESNANPNVVYENGDTPLRLAVFRDDVPMVQQLLEYKAQPDAVDYYRETPASWAASCHMKVWNFLEGALSQSIVKQARAAAWTASLSSVFGYNIYLPGGRLIDGQLPFNTRFFEKEVSCQGLPEVLGRMVQRTLYESINCVCSTTASELLIAVEKACRQNGPLLLSGGYQEHAVRYLFLDEGPGKGLFCVCDTGGMQKKPVSIYRTTSSLDLKHLLGNLVACLRGTESDYQENICFGLKKIPGIHRTNKTRRYETVCHLPLQQTNNCEWTSFEAAVWLLIFSSQKEGTFPQKSQRANQLFRQWQATAKVHFLVQFKDKTEGVSFFLPPFMRQEIIESAIFDLHQDPRVLTKQAGAALRSFEEEFPNWINRRTHFPRVGQTVREFGDQKTNS